MAAGSEGVFLHRERPIGRREELTFRQNRLRGRHGWLRLTPAYSVDLVRSLLSRAEPGARVLEPFSGTGTTALSAVELGLEARAFDINQFLVWFGGVKTRSYRAEDLAATRGSALQIVERIRSGAAPPTSAPPLRNIDRWWSPDDIRLLAALRAGIEDSSEARARDLLLVAFCRTLIALSNAAFNHPSMSFGRTASTPAVPSGVIDEHKLGLYLSEVDSILATTDLEPCGLARIELGDARTLDRQLPEERERFDLLVTSPPYPNRMSYVRELRPYLYWLGYLREGREAGELDWRAIGGTWGVATSRLADWSPRDLALPSELVPLLGAIRTMPSSGPLMAAYLHRYFEDMLQHFEAVQRLLAPGAMAHYIIGNSTFYGVVVPTERIFAFLLAELGFRDVEIEIVRKRNSKKELFEYRVSARRS